MKGFTQSRNNFGGGAGGFAKWIPPATLSLLCLLVLWTWLPGSSHTRVSQVVPDTSYASEPAAAAPPEVHSAAPSATLPWSPPEPSPETPPELPEQQEEEWDSDRWPEGFHGLGDIEHSQWKDVLTELIDLRRMRILYSQTSRTGKYYPIDWTGKHEAYNPSIIPHPTRDDRWIVVAQRLWRPGMDPVKDTEFYCVASFRSNDTLRCDHDPERVPVSIVKTHPVCPPGKSAPGRGAGARDARAFLGVEKPYITYGYPSNYTCFGQWIQDVRMLIDPYTDNSSSVERYKYPTEMEHPGAHPVEKNYHLFWSGGKTYVHTNIWPERWFAEVDGNGRMPTDLAPITRENDSKCYDALMVPHNEDRESLHQASNALSITLCERADPDCIPTEMNTFTMTIFQRKAFYIYHAQYEPFLMLYQSVPPFAVHAIAKKPFWVSGRKLISKDTGAVRWEKKPQDIPKAQSEMFYVTSINWKSGTWHGYLDDVLFIGVGIEDTKAIVIDVLGRDMVQDLGYCSEYTAS